MEEEGFLTSDGGGPTLDIYIGEWTVLEELKSNVLASIYWSRWTKESQNMIVYVRRSVLCLKALMTVNDVHKRGLAWCYIAWCKVALGPHVRSCRCVCIVHLTCCSWQALLGSLLSMSAVVGVNEPWQPVPALYRTLQLILLTDAPCCHTEARRTQYAIKAPGQGFLPCQGTKQQQKSSSDAAKPLSSAASAHPSRLYLCTRKVTTPCRCGIQCVCLALVVGGTQQVNTSLTCPLDITLYCIF